MVDSVATRQAGAREHPCRLVTDGLEPTELEDDPTGVFILFRCLTHGATWRVYAGGRMTQSCTTLALASLGADQSSLAQKMEEECEDDFEGDEFGDFDE